MPWRQVHVVTRTQRAILIVLFTHKKRMTCKQIAFYICDDIEQFRALQDPLRALVQAGVVTRQDVHLREVYYGLPDWKHLTETIVNEKWMRKNANPKVETLLSAIFPMPTDNNKFDHMLKQLEETGK